MDSEEERKQRQQKDRAYFGRLYMKFAKEDLAAGDEVGCWMHLFQWAELGCPK